jgi:hypothetical protein
MVRKDAAYLAMEKQRMEQEQKPTESTKTYGMLRQELQVEATTALLHIVKHGDNPDRPRLPAIELALSK